MIHIGKIIHAELLRQERTPTWLAKKINCERPNIYYIIKQPSINTEMLERISKALDIDFFKIYSDQLNNDSNKIT
ncbi:MAG: XRE family transcriptional regulator [Muribaculaceae bacterium]|nr:XRE family transcriptional regulator [Muribaculaceae bacterium]